MDKTLRDSDHTSIQTRVKELTEEELKQSVKALAGEVKNRTMVLNLKNYIELVEWTDFCILQNLHTLHPCKYQENPLPIPTKLKCQLISSPP